MAAVERLVEPLGGHCQRAVGFRGVRRLPVKGAAQQHQHRQRHGEQRGDLRDVVAPAAQEIAAQLEDRPGVPG